MAQQLWNPNEQYDIDPNTGQYTQVRPDRTMQLPGGAPDMGNIQTAQGGDLDALYKQLFNRAPDANERASDTENIGKYGYDAVAQEMQKRLGNQSGGQQQQAPQYATPTQQWNQQPAMQPQSDELFKLLMQRAQQGTAVSRNDPNVRAQVDPVVAQQERASRNYIDDIAEKSGPLANIQGERRLAAERSGQAAGAFESEIIGRENDRLLQEKMQALQLATQYGTAQQVRDLQREIAYLQDASHTADRNQNQKQFESSQSQSMDQFLRELALREYDTNQGWDYRWATL